MSSDNNYRPNTIQASCAPTDVGGSPISAEDLARLIGMKEAAKEMSGLMGSVVKQRKSITSRVEERIKLIEESIAHANRELAECRSVYELLVKNPEFDRIVTSLARLSL